MKKILVFCAMVLSLGFVSCGSDDDDSSKQDLGGGIYSVNGHKFVDLGLSVLWAETNVGASVATDCGNYYAWGETATKSDYSWSTYKYGTSKNNITKYNDTDKKTTLEAADDAATVNWGAPCRMPTESEIGELKNSDNCTWEWTTVNGFKGYRVTSKKAGYTSNSIFIPAAGEYADKRIYFRGSYGFNWTGTLSAEAVYEACGHTFYSGVYRYWISSDRCNGYTVRPVASK